MDPAAKFLVKTQRQEKSVSEYLENWTWDESKYPKTRSISENVTFLMSMTTKDDDAVRNKTGQFNEAKTLRSNLAKKESANLIGKDLVDVLTPDVIKASRISTATDDFIMSEHLATVVVVLGKGAHEDFVKSYEEFCDQIVPMSAKKFEGLDDKDGNQVWRVVMFKSAVEPFKKACREKRYLPRDFEYSEAAYKKLVSDREQAEEACKKLNGVVRSLYSASWSDAFCAWMHIKAMRVFVESVLRFGIGEASSGPSFQSFVLTPKGGQAAARKALAGAMGGDTAGGDGADDGEEFFPYVSFSFVPFTASRA
jgi:V-type H+-transporting ATPase subunit C